MIMIVLLTFSAAAAWMGRYTAEPAKSYPRSMAGSVVPIVVGYAVAHYATLLIVEGQRTAINFSDPLSREWNVFGSAEMGVNSAIFNHPMAIALIQLLSIIGGHIAAIVVAHEKAVQLLPPDRALVGQWPMLAVMVGYTCAGLVLLFLITTAFHVWTNPLRSLLAVSRDSYAAGMTETPATRELDITLERNSPIPLYYQLAQSIEDAINTGTLAPGDRLENELSLTSRLGLSRPTARQAIQELVKKGMLVRKRGVGTQVVRSQFRRDERLSSFNEDLAKAGKVPGTRLLEYEVGELDEESRDSIDAENVTGDGETFIKIRRLRLADDVPLAILTNYLPSHFDITAADLSTKGLYACLRSIGVNLKIGHERISARLMTEEEAELLEAETPAACLTVDRIAYDDVGQFVEFGRHMYHAAHYSIQSSLVV